MLKKCMLFTVSVMNFEVRKLTGFQSLVFIIRVFISSLSNEMSRCYAALLITILITAQPYNKLVWAEDTAPVFSESLLCDLFCDFSFAG